MFYIHGKWRKSHNFPSSIIFVKYFILIFYVFTHVYLMFQWDYTKLWCRMDLNPELKQLTFLAFQEYREPGIMMQSCIMLSKTPVLFLLWWSVIKYNSGTLVNSKGCLICYTHHISAVTYSITPLSHYWHEECTSGDRELVPVTNKNSHDSKHKNKRFQKFCP